MKRMIIIQGGGRPKGNTAQLVESFAQGAMEVGHQAEVIPLSKYEVKGCTGCNACCYGERDCVQKDSFLEIVAKMKEADLTVFASPLYFWTISSQLKAFIDRFYGLSRKEPAPVKGRHATFPVRDSALLMTSADHLFWTFEHAVSYYRFVMVDYMGFRDKGMLLAGGCGGTSRAPGIGETGYLKEAYEFGKNIYLECG